MIGIMRRSWVVVLSIVMMRDLLHGQIRYVCKQVILHDAWVTAVALSPDQKTVASTMEYPESCCHVWRDVHAYPIACIAHSSDITKVIPYEKGLIFGDYDGSIFYWDNNSLLLKSEIARLKGTITGFSLSKDRQYTAIAARKNIFVWRNQGREIVYTINELDGNLYTYGSPRYTAVILNRDGTQLYTACSWEPTIKLWNFASLEIIKEFVGHSERVTSLALSEDERCLVSASYDGNVMVWNTDTTETTISPWQILPGHFSWCHILKENYKTPVNAIALSSNGEVIVSGGDDNCVRVWHLQKDLK